MSSDADIVVLSLLAEQPHHGYDLDRVIEQRGYRQWTSLAFSSVYYLLKRLSERGLLEPDEGSQGRRTVFRVTEAGRRELRQAAGERVLAPAPPSAGVLPALNAYSRLDDPELVTLLVRRAEALLGRLDELRALRAQVDEEHALAIFDYEILRQEADLAWTRSLLKKAGSDED
ncbi:PadR family transcriptional regulator [Actinomyces viscosus]|uniref:PadR family transcriptional regulator n=1 Tax=Actinomyces viscosus TaxID=1656 RepID=A0ABT7TWI3_ACTVI|nr:PadR family transcriptional regulator [Actinomyces viscosus]MDM8076192.1 PadR family transcriptional regulator [Actinomyces viscosus]